MIKIEEDKFLSLMKRVEEEKSNPDRIFLSDVIIESRGNYHYLISYNPEDYDIISDILDYREARKDQDIEVFDLPYEDGTYWCIVSHSEGSGDPDGYSSTSPCLYVLHSRRIK